MHEIRILLTIKVEGGDGASLDVLTSAHREGPVETVATDVLEGVARAVRPYVESFARQAATQGLRLERPAGARQDYRNVVAPGARVGSRIASVHVRTGRLAVYKVPELVREEPLAETYANNDEPVGVKVYLTSEDRVAAGVRLCRRAVELRGDVRARTP